MNSFALVRRADTVLSFAPPPAPHGREIKSPAVWHDAIKRNNSTCKGTNLPITSLDFRRSDRIKLPFDKLFLSEEIEDQSAQCDPNRLNNREAFSLSSPLSFPLSLSGARD